LREVLRQIKAECGISTSDTYIDKRIAARAAIRLQQQSAAATRSLPPVSAKRLKQQPAAATRSPLPVITLYEDDDEDGDLTPEDFEGHDRIQVDKKATQSRSDKMKARWQNPKRRSILTGQWTDPKRRPRSLAILLARLNKMWADPIFKAKMSEMAIKQWRDFMHSRQKWQRQAQRDGTILNTGTK
jgi:hypothetical protein